MAVQSDTFSPLDWTEANRLRPCNRPCSGASLERIGDGQRKGADGDAGRIATIRAWIGRRPGTSVLIAAACGLVVGAAVAIPIVASKASQVSDLESQLADTSAELDSAEADRDEAQAAADAVASRKDQIIGNARARADDLVGGAKEDLADLKSQLQQAQRDLTSKQDKLESVEASLDQAKETKQMSTFSDGTWSVGQDILAGTYRSTAGGRCYWEILKSPSGGGINNIVDNGFGPGATVTVSTGQWLRVSRCGKWNPGP